MEAPSRNGSALIPPSLILSLMLSIRYAYYVPLNKRQIEGKLGGLMILML